MEVYVIMFYMYDSTDIEYASVDKEEAINKYTSLCNGGFHGDSFSLQVWKNGEKIKEYHDVQDLKNDK